MAGVYGTIDSRAHFFRVLNDAIAATDGLRARSPEDHTVASVAEQLEAMKRWSANHRHPLQHERESVDIGLLAVRELGECGDEEGMADYSERLQELNNYFEDWPSDQEAANASDEDFFEQDDD